MGPSFLGPRAVAFTRRESFWYGFMPSRPVEARHCNCSLHDNSLRTATWWFTYDTVDSLRTELAVGSCWITHDTVDSLRTGLAVRVVDFLLEIPCCSDFGLFCGFFLVLLAHYAAVTFHPSSGLRFIDITVITDALKKATRALITAKCVKKTSGEENV